MVPIKKGTKLTDNPKNQRIEIRLTSDESDLLELLAGRIGTTKADVIIRGIRLVELQKKNKEFEELSNCLIVRELNVNKQSYEDRKTIISYAEKLIEKYEK